MSDGVIASAGSKSNMLVFSLNEYKGRRTFDIRKFYTDKKSGDLIPTRKGIALTSKSAEIMMGVLNENKDKIHNWLNDNNSVVDEIIKNDKAIDKISRSSRFSAKDHSIEVDKWKSPEFFYVVAEGGRDRLVLNETHRVFNILFSLLDELESESNSDKGGEVAQQLRILFESIFISFGKSRQLFDDSEEIFDSMMFNWGILLDNYLSKLSQDLK